MVALERRQQGQEAVVAGGMGFALRQGALGDRRRGGQGRQAVGIVHQARRMTRLQLAGIAAQVIGEPRPPGGRDPIAGLQHAARPAPLAAAHQAGMTAVHTGQELHHRGRFAVRPRAQHDALVLPFHGSKLHQFTPRSRGPSGGSGPGPRASPGAP